MSPARHRSRPLLVTPTIFLLGALGVLGVPPLGHPVARAAEKLRFKSVADFTRCVDGYQAAPETCLEVLDAFVKATPAQAFAAGKAVRAKMNHAAAIPFFAKAFARTGAPSAAAAKTARAQCADEDVAMALVAGLDLSAGRGTAVSAALGILDRCWDETQAPVLKALGESGPSGFLAQNLCPRLAERKVTNPACEKKPAAAASSAEAPWTWREIDPKAMAVDGPSKVYRGAEGRTLTLVKLKTEDAYLIKFDGFRGAWNGRIVLHREGPVSSGYDYFTQVKGSRWVSVVVRDGNTEVYPAGDKGPFAVAYDETASKAPAAAAQAVLDQFRKQKM